MKFYRKFLPSKNVMMAAISSLVEDFILPNTSSIPDTLSSLPQPQATDLAIQQEYFVHLSDLDSKTNKEGDVMY